MPSYFALVPCDCCGVLFDAETDTVVVDIPNTRLRLLVIGDFCSVCSSLVRVEVEDVFKGFTPSGRSDKRR